MRSKPWIVRVAWVVGVGLVCVGVLGGGVAAARAEATDWPQLEAMLEEDSEAGSPEEAVEADLLAGPEAAVSDAPASLIRYGYDGEMARQDPRRADLTVEELALDLLELNQADRMRVDRVLSDRAALLDRLVMENYQFILRLQGFGALSQEERRAAMREALEVLAPLREGGTLGEQIAAALPEEQRDRYWALLDEYVAAERVERILRKQRERAAEAMAGRSMEGMPAEGMAAMDGPDDAEREALMTRESDRVRRAREARAGRPGAAAGGFQSLGISQSFRIELRRSLERTVGQQVEGFERVLQDLDVSPEQEAEIRAMVLDARNKATAAGRGNLSREERRALMRRVIETLDPEQRRRAVQMMRRGEFGVGG